MGYVDSGLGGIVDSAGNNKEYQKLMQDMAMKWTSARPIVASYISSLVMNHHDSEDLLQRTASALVAKYEEYDDKRPFAAWAIGIARIEVLRYRQEKKRDRLVFDETSIQSIADAYQEFPFEASEIQNLLRKCIEHLQGRAKQILESRYIKGISVSHIAKEYGATPNAIWITLHRSRLALRDCVQNKLQIRGGGV